MRTIKGFSILELLIIISMVTGLIIVAAPSFYGIFKTQFLIYNTHQLIQSIRGVQTLSFVEHAHYKVKFNDEIAEATIYKMNGTDWALTETITFDDTITLQYNHLLSNTSPIMYGPNGNAFLCNGSESVEMCQQTPLASTAKLTLKTPKKEIILEFLPFNGLVSSNISIEL
ncbi:MAG: hypothetical protein ISQ13_03975 [Candidatus Margulisbacteria bacterium]|nr:hypothetical protein [Candidatus Margulisiibacteriota bacterium]